MSPTLAERAGVLLLTDRIIDGKSLVPTLQRKADVHREWIFSDLSDKRMFHDKRWLLEGNGRFYDCGNNRGGGYPCDSKMPYKAFPLS